MPADGQPRVYNIATGVGTTFRELATQVVELTGSHSTIDEQIVEPPGRDLVADISLARAELGYAPEIGLREGLEHYEQWLRRKVK
jgi:nucleoside-diphosphate-sugar epimerase